jgi:hypothetical protein
VAQNRRTAAQKIAVQARKEIQQAALQEIVRSLNEGFNREHPLAADAHPNFVRLIQAWQQAPSAKPNRFEHFEREAGAPVPTLLKMNFPPGCPNWREIEKRCRAFLSPSGTGAHSWVQYVGEKGKPWTAWDIAVQQFISLITNPDHHKFSGPCARCGHYYIKKRASQKVYCSRTCGNAATAVARTRERWDRARGKRLKQAQKAMQKWSALKTTEPFQAWAERHYKGLTKKFLTRAINNGELPEPMRKGAKP